MSVRLKKSTVKNFRNHQRPPICFLIKISVLMGLLVIPSAQNRCQEKSRDASPTSSLQRHVRSPESKTQPLALEEAVRLALEQASSFQQAEINERIAAEDVKQARTAFLPKITAPASYIYTSPQRGFNPRGLPSFIANNAINEYQAVAQGAGDIDLSLRLTSTLRRNRALLQAAHAGTEAARRALVEATEEAYFGLALASTRRQSAERNLAAAEEFEHITDLLLKGGEVSEIDQVRARLQTTTRRDEFTQSEAAEAAAADALRVFLGYDFSTPLAAMDLLSALPVPGEVERFTAEAAAKRPELAQLEAERRAADQDAKIARADRLPQLSYIVNSGFDTDSLQATSLRQHTGSTVTVNLTVPLFDWGASRDRQKQAQLRADALESTRQLAARSFAQQFYSTRARAVSAASRIQLAQAGVADAQRNLETSVTRYRAGEAPIIEVTDAQSTVAAQRIALSQAVFDYQSALARLRQATGQ